MQKIFLALVMGLSPFSLISSMTPQQEVETYIQNLSQNDKEQLVHFFNKLVEEGHDQHSIEKLICQDEKAYFVDFCIKILVLFCVLVLLTLIVYLWETQGTSHNSNARLNNAGEFHDTST